MFKQFLLMVESILLNFLASTFISLRFAGLIIVFGLYSDNQKTLELEDDF